MEIHAVRHEVSLKFYYAALQQVHENLRFFQQLVPWQRSTAHTESGKVKDWRGVSDKNGSNTAPDIDFEITIFAVLGEWGQISRA